MSDVPLPNAAVAAANPALAALGRGQRRRLLLRAALRVVATTLLLLVVYFAIPIGGKASTWSIITLVVSLLGLTISAGFQVRRIIDAPLPQLRAIETLATAIPAFLVIFALVYVTMSEVDPGAFDEPVTRIAALYFTVTVFTTVGFGDIVAQTDAARAVVTVQMLLDLVILGGLVRVVIGASQLGLVRRRSEASQPPGSQPSV